VAAPTPGLNQSLVKMSRRLPLTADSCLSSTQLNTSQPMHVALYSYVSQPISCELLLLRNLVMVRHLSLFHASFYSTIIIMSHSRKLILLLFTFIGGLAADGWDGAILAYDGYEHLRTCAQMCIARYGNADQPGILIGCPEPVYDSCFCRGLEDLATEVTSLISSCVNIRYSSDQTDVTAAFAVYDGYRSQAGYPHLAVNSPATTTLDGSSVAAAGIPTSTVLVITTATGSSGVSSAATREYIPRLLLLCMPVVLGLL
jgi:hypothetical protein